MLKELLTDESGATAIEYAMMLGTIALAIVGAVTSLGGTEGTMYNDIAAQYVNALSG